MSEDRVEIKSCVGRIYVSQGDWVVPYGKTIRDSTICEWCVKNGCISMDGATNVDKADYNTFYCNCDCPNIYDHECLSIYICEKHRLSENKGMLMDCGMCQCASKPCQQMTTSGMIKHCDGCSAVFQICKYCGEK